MTSALLERLYDTAYQFCVVDREGDYWAAATPGAPGCDGPSPVDHHRRGASPAADIVAPLGGDPFAHDALQVPIAHHVEQIGPAASDVIEVQEAQTTTWYDTTEPALAFEQRQLPDIVGIQPQ